jgi:UDP-N-acetyl-D-glucosamine dehydrogenase
VDPGNERWLIRNTPKVIGGITPACLERGVALYRRAMQTVVPVSSTETAELTKLLENTFRAVNIALVNEMAQVCDRLDVDVFEVIEAAATKPFGFMKFTPGPGIGGHCIPLDPHYLAWKMKTLNYRTRMIELAGEVNSEMPRFVVEKVQDALNDAGRPVRRAAGCWCWALRTRRTSTTCGRAPRWTSSGCWRRRAPTSCTTTRT